MSTEIARITATDVPAHKRMGIMPQYAGVGHMIELEARIFNVMARICPEYTQGMWLFTELSNDAFFMYPNMDAEEVRIVVAGNYFSGALSPADAGLVACLFAFSEMAWKTRDERFSDLFYKLREYAGQLDYANQIFRAID